MRATAIPTNTKHSTDWGIRVWQEWAGSRAAQDGGIFDPLTTPLLQLSPESLAYWMGKFVLEVRKQNGTEYPPKTIYALICCFKRYFEKNGVHDINPLSVNDSRFGNFRVTLDAEMKRLHGLGLGTVTKRAEPISPDEECLLWSSGQFGCRDGKALLNTVHYYNCKIFSLCSYDEHRNLLCSQYEKKVDGSTDLFAVY